MPTNDKSFKIVALAISIACVGVFGLFLNNLPQSNDFIPPEVRPGMTRVEVEKVLNKTIAVQNFANDAQPPAGCQGFYNLTYRKTKIFYTLYFDKNDTLVKIDRSEL